MAYDAVKMKDWQISEAAEEKMPTPDEWQEKLGLQKDEVLAYGRGSDNDTAWFGRIQVGDYKKPGQIAIRFSRYDSKPDAIFFAYGQSDARRSSNVDGYRTDLRIGLPKDSHINFTWYRTNWTLGNDTIMNRIFLDFIFPF